MIQGGNEMKAILKNGILMAVIKQLWTEGCSVATISRQTGLTHRQVYNILTIKHHEKENE